MRKFFAQEESKAEAEEKLGLRLVEVLQGPQRLVHLSSQEKHLPWGARAMTVYRVCISKKSISLLYLLVLFSAVDLGV